MMDAKSLASSILSHGNLPIPGEVASELLSMVPSDEVPNSLLNFGEFSGEAAISVAKSSPQKAKIIAGNTTDPNLQRALLELPHSHDVVLNEMVRNNKVQDESLLMDIHKLVWEDQVHSAAYKQIRDSIVRFVPLGYALDFLVARETRGYPLQSVGFRTGQALARGEFWVLERIDAISKSHAESKDPSNFEKFVDEVGRSLAREGSIEHVLDILTRAESVLHPKHADRLSMSVLRGSPVVDEKLLEFCFKYLPTPDEFLEYQLRIAAARHGGYLPVAPSELTYMRSPYTIGALRLLAVTYPGAMLNAVNELDPTTEHCSEILDLALDSNLHSLAHALLSKNSVKATTENSVNLSPLTAAQFHKVLEVYENGAHVSRSDSSRPALSSFPAARSIPKDASIDDVVRLLRLSANAPEVIHAIYAPPVSGSISYYPTGDEMRVLLASLTDMGRLEVMSKVLNTWSYCAHPNHTAPKPEHFDEVVAVIMDSVPASAVAADRQGAAYITHVFNANFGSDVEKWRHALGLVATALVPLSKVVSATKRLY